MECVWTTGKRFLEINFPHLIGPEIIVKEFINSATPGAAGSVPVHIGTVTLIARDEDRIRGAIPMPTFARRPSTVSSFLPVEIPQNSMVGQQNQQISKLQFDKFPALSTFLCWKIRFKNQVTSCSDFTLGGYVMDQRS